MTLTNTDSVISDESRLNLQFVSRARTIRKSEFGLRAMAQWCMSELINCSISGFVSQLHYKSNTPAFRAPVLERFFADTPHFLLTDEEFSSS